MKLMSEELQGSLRQKPMINRLPPISIHKNEFDSLCHWIDDHLAQPIGWHELMAQSRLDYQTLHALFFKYESTTPMAWIRRRREANSGAAKAALPMQLLSKQSAQIPASL
jgi:methylphosphotriester-DNA--protein-cysteine methyltransferase